MKLLNITNKKLLISAFLLTFAVLHSLSFAMITQEEKEEFVRQHRIFLQRVESEQNMPIDNDKWAVSILVQPGADPTGMTGHGILAFIGKQDDHPLFWAADFNGNFSMNDPMSVGRAIFFVSDDAKIRTTDNQDGSRADLMNALQGFSAWRYRAWSVPKEKAQEIQKRIVVEKEIPPSFNLLGQTFELLPPPFKPLQPTSIHNCSSWAVEKVRQCDIDISGTLLYQLFGISATGHEQYCNHG